MKTRALLAAATPILALTLAACGNAPSDSPDAGDRPTPPRQQQPTGGVRGNDGPAPNLPDGWLESMQKYADCLNQNGGHDIKVDKQRGGLALDTVLPPDDAVSKCMQYNPVHKQGGAKEGSPDAG